MSDDNEAFVWISPARVSGTPCIGGRRVPTATVAGMALSGESFEEIAECYDATPRQVLIACWYEATFHSYDWPKKWQRWAQEARGPLARLEDELPAGPPTAKAQPA